MSEYWVELVWEDEWWHPVPLCITSYCDVIRQLTGGTSYLTSFASWAPWCHLSADRRDVMFDVFRKLTWRDIICQLIGGKGGAHSEPVPSSPGDWGYTTCVSYPAENCCPPGNWKPWRVDWWWKPCCRSWKDGESLFSLTPAGESDREEWWWFGSAWMVRAPELVVISWNLFLSSWCLNISDMSNFSFSSCCSACLRASAVPLAIIPLAILFLSLSSSVEIFILSSSILLALFCSWWTCDMWTWREDLLERCFPQ